MESKEIMELTERQNKLLEFVKEQHGEQKRKYTNEPYWKHCYNVGVMANVNNNKDLTVEIGFCHDLFEDTKCKEPELYESLKEFGYSEEERQTVCWGVKHLTDVYTKENYPDANRKQRKLLEAKRMYSTPSFAQTVKYCDLIDNTSTIVNHDKKFAKVYLKEKKRMLGLMRNGNIDLLIKCCYTLQKAMNEISA